MIETQIYAFGSSSPSGRISNEKLAAVMKVNPDWIEQNIGIKERAVLGPGEGIVSMAVAASNEAIKLTSQFMNQESKRH